MPLDINGSYATSGSSGASARNAVRVSSDTPSTATADVAVPAVRDEKPAREEVAVSSPSANVAVYVSPFIRLDITSRLAIVEIRNSETGEVQQQYPSPRAVREYTQNLPEDSDLRAGTQSESSDASQQPRVIGSAADNATQAAQTPPGLQAPAAPAAPASPASPQAAAAATAFGSFQSVPTGGKQLAIA
jgi:hypothetical protein